MYLARAEHALLPVVIPWIVSLCAVALLFSHQPFRRPQPRLMDRLPEILIVTAVTLLALALRVPNLETLPTGIAGDEGEFGVLAFAVAEGRGPDPFGVAFLGDPALYVHLIAPWVALLGPTMEAIRLPSALIGAASVPALYLLVRELGGRFPATLAAILLATSAVHIHFSRLALNVIEMPFFACLSLWFLVLGITRKENVSYLLAGILGGLGFYFHFGARLLAPILLLILAGQLVAAPRAWRSWLRSTSLVGFGGFLAVSPMLAHLANNPTLLTDHVGSRGIWNHWERLARRYETTPADKTGILWEQVRATFDAFTVQADSIYGAQFYTFAHAPLLNQILAPLALFGLVLLAIQARQLRSQAVLIWFLVPVVLASILTDTAGQAHRLIHPTVPALVAIALFIDWCRRLAFSRLSRTPATIVVSFMFLLPATAGLWDGLSYVRPGATDRFAPAHTAQARCMEALPPGTVVAVVGAPHIYARHGPSRYLGHHVQRRELNNPSDELPIDTRGEPLVILVHEWRHDTLPTIRDAYAEAQPVEVERPEGERVLTVFAIAADGGNAANLAIRCASNAAMTDS